MALAHARLQKLSDSQKILAQLAQDGSAPQRLKAKVKSLAQKVDAARCTGTRIEFADPKSQVEECDDDMDFISLGPTTSNEDKAVAQLSETPKTMLGLYRIYKSATEHSEFAKSLG